MEHPNKINIIKRSIKIIISIILFFLDTIIIFIANIWFNTLGQSNKENNQKILIVNTGALGDIIILINSLQNIPLKERKVFNILVDKKYISLFRQKGFDKLLAVDSKRYFKDFFYRSKFNIQLFKSNQYKIIANLRGSRNIIYEDSMVRFLKSKSKIALESDNFTNSKTLINLLDSLIYNKIIQFDKKLIKHESEKSFLIFDAISDSPFFDKLNLNDISIFFEDLCLSRKIKDKYFTINVGAGQKWKKWEIEKFVELGNYICSNTYLKAIYLGLEEDYRSISRINSKIHPNSVNLCGKTNFHSYFSYIKNSEFSITNDSSAIHLSIFFQGKALCIKSEFANESWYPYPKSVNQNKWRLIEGKKLKDISVNSILTKIDDWIGLYGKI